MGNNPTAIPWSSGSYTYLHLFHIYPWALGVEIMFQIHEVGLGSRVPHFDLLWFLLVFSVTKRSLLMRGKDSTYLYTEKQMFTDYF